MQRFVGKAWRFVRIGSLVIFGGLVGLLVVAAGFQAASSFLDAQAYSPKGATFAVDGRKQHLLCTGEGEPTIVLESAIAATTLHWSWVQPKLAGVTRVCAYDRAGLGWSEASSAPRDARTMSRELHALLEAAGEKAPYVIVSHSLGALTSRAFAAEYPDEVAGMVLVDGTHPDLWARLPPALAHLPDEIELQELSIVAALGLVRLNIVNPFPVDDTLPDDIHKSAVALNATTKAMGAISGELRAIPASTAYVRSLHGLGDKPLIVLTAGTPYSSQPPEVAIPARKAWFELQRDLLGLSTNAVQRIVPGSTHESLVYAETDAAQTVRAARDVVEAVRSGARLK
jgi:pimeloyl-ACP methyl ester carboxylesterase